MTLTTREEAWQQLTECLDIMANEARTKWPEDVEDKKQLAHEYLLQNPVKEPGHGTTVTMKLAPASINELTEIFDRGLFQLQEQVDRMSLAVDLIQEMASAEEFWASVVETTIIRGTASDGGERIIELSQRERDWLRDIVGQLMLYGGKKSLTGVFNPSPITRTPIPEFKEADPEPASEIDVEAGITVVVGPPPVEPLSHLAAVRKARNPAAKVDEPLPPPTPGVETWDGAPEHNCREDLDADDVCTTCGRYVPTGAGGRVLA